ncbi:MAG TPA: carboxypeptidase regulatory-like domain-containing protein [Candidatus Acidoferrales bacterium]|nr:carboxypeptidase regulatory-like domain-containing protein [Candidatus Acidoferrales bacterium]
MRLLRSFFLVAFCICGWAFLGSSTPGQTNASLRGTVTDQSGGVVVGAKITLTNTATGISLDTVTRTDGSYLFDLVQVGKYKLTVEKPGFETFIQAGITLELNQNGRVEVSLKVGRESQTVEVTANVAQVDTTSAVLGKVENERAIRDLPLLDRDTLQLGLLQAGVFPPDQDDGSGNPFSVSGQRSESLTFLLDGANNTDFLGNNIVVSPNPDAVEEFKILTNNYDAEYGRTSGGIVNQITKSGTNAFHGDVFEFLRNDVLNSTDYLADGLKSAYRRNVFGATLGGPVKKDKSFFFLAYQGTRRGEGMTPSPIAVLSVPERSGDFSADTVQLVNPITGSPYPNNQVPVNPVIANYIAKYMPLPSPGQTNIFTASPLAAINDDQGIAHWDYNATPQDTISFAYLVDDTRGFFPEEGGTISSATGLQPSGSGGDVPVGSGGLESTRNQIGTFTWTHTFSSGKINEFRFGASRYASTQAVPTDRTSPETLGFTNVTPADPAGVAPPIIFGPSFTLGPSGQGPTKLHRASFEWSDNFTWTRGKHEIKFGVDLTRIRNNFDFDFFNNGSYDFTFGDFTGDEYADFVAGFWDNYFQSSPATYGIRTGSAAGYIQDTWKILPRLTLNYGLRYEYYVPQHDIHNEILGWFPGQQSTVFPLAPPNILYPGDPGTPNSGLVYPDYNNFAPRFGFAWDMFGNSKLVMRGGFGIFYDIEDGALNLQFGGEPPFGFIENADSSFGPGSPSDCAASGCGAVKDPWSVIGQPNPYNPFVRGFANPAPIPFAYLAFPHFRTPYSENFNYGFQWQAAKDTMIEAVYVGSLGRKLISSGELNFPQPSIEMQQLQTYGQVGPECARKFAACIDGTLNPLDPFDPTGTPTGPQQLLTNFSNGLSDSDQFQLTVDKRFGHGLMFRAAYTLAKTIDLTSGFRARSSEFTDPLDPRLDRSLADFDVPQRLVLSGIYELPFARSIHSDGILKKVADGWQANLIASFQKGNPITFFSNSNASEQNQSPDLTRVNVIGSVPHANPKNVNQTFSDPTDGNGNDVGCIGGGSAQGHFWINPSNMVCAPCPLTDFNCSQPGDVGIPLFTFGDLSRNSIRGPGINNFDISLVKKTPIRETKSLEFRAEFFNAFNHTQFFRVDNSGLSSTFGQVLSDRGPRIIQLALKFYF